MSPAITRTAAGQAKAPATQPFGADAFADPGRTELRWLTMAGFLVNSHGTTAMIDPLLGEFDMPLMADSPIAATDVPHLDAVLVTHSDNDHYSRSTCADLAGVTDAYHSTRYVASLMAAQQLPAHGHGIGETFELGPMSVRLTPADHAWQNAFPGTDEHWHEPDDACGFWIDTPDGTLWALGDSRLIRDHHLTQPAPDAMLFDFSDSEWHFTLDGAVEIANTYPDTPLLLHHWGCVDAADFPPFNGDPEVLATRVTNPERIHVLAPGEPYVLSRLT